MDPPCELKEIDTQKLMLETQLELGLRSRNAVSTDRTTYWYKVYDTIFGSEARRQRPVEPCKTVIHALRSPTDCSSLQGSITRSS